MIAEEQLEKRNKWGPFVKWGVLIGGLILVGVVIAWQVGIPQVNEIESPNFERDILIGLGVFSFIMIFVFIIWPWLRSRKETSSSKISREELKQFIIVDTFLNDGIRLKSIINIGRAYWGNDKKYPVELLSMSTLPRPRTCNSAFTPPQKYIFSFIVPLWDIDTYWKFEGVPFMQLGSLVKQIRYEEFAQGVAPVPASPHPLAPQSEMSEFSKALQTQVYGNVVTRGIGKR